MCSYASVHVLFSCASLCFYMISGPKLGVFANYSRCTAACSQHGSNGVTRLVLLDCIAALKKGQNIHVFPEILACNGEVVRREMKQGSQNR